MLYSENEDSSGWNASMKYDTRTVDPEFFFFDRQIRGCIIKA